MSNKKKILPGILLSIVMVLGVMSGMSRTVHADDTPQSTTGELIIEKIFEIAPWPPYDDSPLDITVINTWNDNNNSDGKRPESVIVRLLANGTEVADTQLNAGNNWRYTFTGLPRIDEDKEKINYTITEDPVKLYTAQINGFNIRNNYEPKAVQMILRGNSGSAGEQRTANLALDVLLNAPEGADLSGLVLAIEGPDPQLKKTLTYDDVKDGSINLGKVLPGAYLVRDTNADTLVGDYVMDAGNSKVADAVYVASGASARLEFRYTWKPQEPIDKDADWDYDPYNNIGNLSFLILGPDARMPKTINYSEFKDDKYKLSDLVPGVYTVVECNAETLLEYYTLTSSSITGLAVEVKAGETATARLFNEYVTPEPYPEFVNIPVTQTWNDNNNADDNRPTGVMVRLYADGVEVDSHVLTAAENWQHTFFERPYYKEDNRTEIIYTVGEDAVAMYTTTINGYNIVNDYQPEVTSVSVLKVWDDNNNEQNTRPESITMRLSAGQKVVKSVVLNEANGWTATVNNLSTVVSGQPVKYSWEEQLVLNYSLESVTQQGSLTIFTNKVRVRTEVYVATTPLSNEPVFPYTICETEINGDGSITSTATTYFEDGSITELVEREWVKGKKKGRKNTKETVMDPEGKTLSQTKETISFSKKQTKTETKDIKKADGYSFSSTEKTYKSGKRITKVSETLKSGVKQEYTETENPDGTMTRKVMDTNTKGRSTLTVTTVVRDEDDTDMVGTYDNNGLSGTDSSDALGSGEGTANERKLVKTVTEYKVTGDGRIRLTGIKTDSDTVIIPKSVTFEGHKLMIVSLGKGLFKGMEGIKKIYIYSENLKKIYAGAFNGVPADAEFYIKASDVNIEKIVRMIRKSGFGKVDYTKI